ncbi:MAG: hypothetical protein WC551_08235 [Patescibacteria group bacterium]
MKCHTKPSDFLPIPPSEGPPLPRFMKCALAGTALAAVLLAPPADMLSKRPTQVASEVSSAVQETLSAKPTPAVRQETPAPTAPAPTPPPSPAPSSSGAVGVSFTVVG